MVLCLNIIILIPQRTEPRRSISNPFPPSIADARTLVTHIKNSVSARLGAAIQAFRG